MAGGVSIYAVLAYRSGAPAYSHEIVTPLTVPPGMRAYSLPQLILREMNIGAYGGKEEAAPGAASLVYSDQISTARQVRVCSTPGIG